MTHHDHMVEAMIHFWILREEANKQKAKLNAEKTQPERTQDSKKAA